MKAVREMGQGLSDHHALRKVRLVSAWIKRREVLIGVRRIRNKKFREHQFIEGYVKCLKSKRVK